MPGNFSCSYLSCSSGSTVCAHTLTPRSQPGETASGSTFSFTCLVWLARDSPHGQWQLDLDGDVMLNILVSASPSPASKATKYMHTFQPVAASSGILLCISSLAPLQWWEILTNPSVLDQTVTFILLVSSILCLVCPLSHLKKLPRKGQLFVHLPFTQITLVATWQWKLTECEW